MSHTSTQAAPQRYDTTSQRLLHVAYQAPGIALCGARITNTARHGTDSRRCVVCLDLATHGRHHTR